MGTSLITLAASNSTDYEQLAKTFNIITIVFFILACVFFACAVFSFIIFKIPNVIGDLSGRNARKSIAKIRQNNEKSQKKSYRPHPIASERGTVTETIEHNKTKSESTRKSSQSVKSSNQEIEVENATDVLDSTNATVKLDYDSNGTELLSKGTEVLSDDNIKASVSEQKITMNMIQDIVLIHTEEVI